MARKKTASFKQLVVNLLIIIALSVGIVLTFFYIVLPSITDHGESVTVPDLKGMHIDELENFLAGRNLSYRVAPDSGYSPDYKPLSVLKQFPVPYAKVKEKRKIYVTLNSAQPPNVKMPGLVNTSVKSAQMILRTLDLTIGEIKYVPDFAANNIMKQLHNGSQIEEGTLIPKGSKIDLEVGDGLGNQMFDVPNITGFSFDEAQINLYGSGLKIGTVVYEKSLVSNDKVLKQEPEVGTIVKTGDRVNLWISKQDSTQIK